MAKVSSRCLHYFPVAMLVSLGGTLTWLLHTGLCKFVQNISTNIWSLGTRIDLKLGEVSYLFFLYNCWRALARQHPILYNGEKKAKSFGCKIEDMRSRLCFFFISGHSGVLVDARGNTRYLVTCNQSPGITMKCLSSWPVTQFFLIWQPRSQDPIIFPLSRRIWKQRCE